MDGGCRLYELLRRGRRRYVDRLGWGGLGACALDRGDLGHRLGSLALDSHRRGLAPVAVATVAVAAVAVAAVAAVPVPAVAVTARGGRRWQLGDRPLLLTLVLVGELGEVLALRLA